MFLIRLRNSGQIIGEAEFKKINSNTSFPAELTDQILNEFEADKVLKGVEPTISDRYKFVFEQGVEQIDGKWFTKFVIGPVFTDTKDKTAAQLEAEYVSTKNLEKAVSVRAERNRRLTESDWTQVADAPVDQAAWAAYRQALRDIPSQEGFPWEVTWAVEP